MLAAGLTLNVLVVITFLSAGFAPESAALSERAATRYFFIACAVLTMIFSFVFSWFVSGYFVMKRKHEIATWLLLGMRRKTAFSLSVGELALASLAALFAGTLLSLALNRFFAIILGYLMRERRAVAIPVRLSTIGAAAGLVFLQTALVAVRVFSALKKLTLAELFRSERMAESMTTYRPLRAVLAILLLGCGYGGASVTDYQWATPLMIPVLIATILGTFLFFDCLVPLIVNHFRSRYALSDGALLIAAAQTSFRMRRNACVLALVAVLVAVAATAAGSMFTLVSNDSIQVSRVCPNDVELAGSDSGSFSAAEARLDERLKAICEETGEAAVSKRMVRVLQVSLIAEAKPETVEVAALPFSDWKGLLSETGRYKDIPEMEDSTIIFSSAYLSRQGFKGGLSAGFNGLWVEGKLAVRDETNAVSVQNAISQIILSDAAWQKLAAYAKETGDESRIRSIAVWNIGRHEILKGRGGSLRAAIEAGGGASDIRLLLRSESFDSFGRESGGLMFIGSFLAAAFLIAAASTIAFKQMEDAEDDKGRYLLLSEIGMSAKDAKRAVSFQVFSGFFLPLCMGVIHTLFALRMLHTVTGFFVGLPALGVAGAAVLFFLCSAFLVADRYKGTVVGRA